MRMAIVGACSLITSSTNSRASPTALLNRCPQAAVNVSVVRGRLSKERAANMSARGRGVAAGDPYAAAAMSLVFHPAHPMVPTLRADVRLFEVPFRRCSTVRMSAHISGACFTSSAREICCWSQAVRHGSKS